MTAENRTTCLDCTKPPMTPKHAKCSECYKRDKLDREMQGEVVEPKYETVAYKVLQDQVAIITLWQKRFMDTIRSDDRASLREEAGMLSNVSKALSSVSKEMLSFQKAEMEDVKNMSKEQWMEAIGKWFSKLPQNQRNTFLDKLYEIHWSEPGRLRVLGPRAGSKEGSEQ